MKLKLQKRISSMIKIKKVIIFSILIIFLLNILGYSQNQQDVINNFINKYKDICIDEMKKNKIPVSIKLSQAIIESSFGTSQLAIEANNFFGIKCKSTWNGEKYFYDDDEKQECFRKYSSPLLSFKDHSLFLLSNERYKKLFDLSIYDYKSWAYLLKENGYATVDNYAELIIKNIETYNLNKFDSINLKNELINIQENDLYTKPTKKVSNSNHFIKDNLELFDSLLLEIPISKLINDSVFMLKYQQISLSLKDTKSINNQSNNDSVISTLKIISELVKDRIKINNNVKYILSKDGETFLMIAEAYNVPYNNIFLINDLSINTNKKLLPNTVVYIEPKKLKSKSIKFHIVKEKETLYDISQIYGIKLNSLIQKNYIKKDDLLILNDTINLQLKKDIKTKIIELKHK